MIKKRTAFFGAIILIVFTMFVTSIADNMIAIKLGDKVVITKKDYDYMVKLQKDLGKMLELKKFIKKYYYKPVDDKIFADGIIKGLFESLGDPYSVYMTKSEFDSFKTQTKGIYGGIGVIVSPGKDGYITVVAPIEDTPGERAGIISGDKIVKVNDKEVTADKLEEAVAMMKGKPGTTVDLTLIRPNNKEPIHVSIKREKIRLKTVKSRIIDNNIGYIKITMFDEKTSEDFKKHLRNLEKKNIKGLIIDLRNNPGGSLNECVKIADELLGKQIIVYTQDRTGKKEYKYSDDKKKVNYPFVILVNGGSASASEILTGAVKDTKSGVIIGTTTFGKGLVQMVDELPDGTGFRLTIAQYFTPNGNYIHGTGIKPDIVIDLPEELKGKIELSDEEDVQLQKALEVLRNKIK
ncbi:C-terminal processing peptidase-3. Serine peptidase. MEROPS family S41A [Caminicella sporogenes DSM 14501]|uniref:C-terminal processing peptidase-3. Serine peptidase. MEROPS family S41A n=1 Tax=Caminicella sporogenes DSM 14501 TaxID=1121266 RepID=A0A1M6QJL1_9FIRM|nr:S41 family peptidase [Caminicella sporogenes]RKD25291.1 peptidase S41 [Caminicella sporogenes]SHK20358.1 C-terminal processing peptidase-3. Serine peptidase. MEROPS family S41A [Caminicella sporogenes DSM 14501]